MGKIETHDGIAGLEDCRVCRLIRLRAGMRLHVDVFGAEQLLRTVARDLFNLIDEFAAAVITLTR
jgi:hypothetical protein